MKNKTVFIDIVIVIAKFQTINNNNRLQTSHTNNVTCNIKAFKLNPIASFACH